MSQFYYVPDLNSPVPDTEAQMYKCPECGVAPKATCVYIWLKSIDTRYQTQEWSLSCLSENTRRLIARVGTQCQKSHNARRFLAWQNRRKRYAKQHLPPITPAVARARETSKLLRDWELVEHNQLVAWFKEHGNIFKEG